METTGQRIKAARIAAGMTQQELADKVGVKYAAIHKYEAGLVVNLKRDTIAKLASALGVQPTYLLCIEDEESTDNKDVSDLLEALRTRPEMRMLFSVSKDATKEDIEKSVAIIEALRKTEGR